MQKMPFACIGGEGDIRSFMEGEQTVERGDEKPGWTRPAGNTEKERAIRPLRKVPCPELFEAL